MHSYDVPFAYTTYEYFPFNGRQKPLFLLSDVTSHGDRSAISPLVPGWCRFTCTQKMIAPIQRVYYTYYINIEIKWKFGDSVGPLQVEFPVDSSGLQFIDVYMGNTKASQWTEDTAFELPGGEKLFFHTKGLPAHYCVRSIMEPDYNHPIEEVCRTLQSTLVNALIKDVWIENLHPSSQIVHRGIPTGKLLFVIGLWEVKDPEKFPNFPTVLLSRRNKILNRKDLYWAAYSPVSDVEAAIQRLPDWLTFTDGQRIEVLAHQRIDWCTQCGVASKQFHALKECPAPVFGIPSLKVCKPPFNSLQDSKTFLKDSRLLVASLPTRPLADTITGDKTTLCASVGCKEEDDKSHGYLCL
jgi:hypothetical protein